MSEFNPNKGSKVSDDALQQFTFNNLSGDLSEIPGVGPSTVVIFKNADITTTFQLIGKFLSFKGEGVDSIEHCDAFFNYIKGGLKVPPANCPKIVHCIASLMNLKFDGLYDAEKLAVEEQEKSRIAAEKELVEKEKARHEELAQAKAEEEKAQAEAKAELAEKERVLRVQEEIKAKDTKLAEQRENERLKRKASLTLPPSAPTAEADSSASVGESSTTSTPPPTTGTDVDIETNKTEVQENIDQALNEPKTQEAADRASEEERKRQNSAIKKRRSSLIAGTFLEGADARKKREAEEKADADEEAAAAAKIKKEQDEALARVMAVREENKRLAREEEENAAKEKLLKQQQEIDKAKREEEVAASAVVNAAKREAARQEREEEILAAKERVEQSRNKKGFPFMAIAVAVIPVVISLVAYLKPDLFLQLTALATMLNGLGSGDMTPEAAKAAIKLGTAHAAKAIQKEALKGGGGMGGLMGMASMGVMGLASIGGVLYYTFAQGANLQGAVQGAQGAMQGAQDLRRKF